MISSTRGVTSPANQGKPANEGTPNTVIAASKVEFYVTEYFDTEGRRQKDLLLRLGDEFYVPQDGSSKIWTQALNSVRPWLRDGVHAKLPLDSNVVVKDSVDIL